MGGGGDGSVARAVMPGGATGAAIPSSSSGRARQASRGPPSAYRISRVARRPGGPYRLRATSTALRCPTTSRPRRIQPERRSSRRRPLASSTAAARLRPRLAGLQHDQQRARPACERGEPAQPVPHPLAGHRRIPALRQVHDQQVHGPGGQQRAREGECLLEVHRRQDHQPLRANTARDGLHGIEGTGEVQPGDDRPAGLRLRGDPQRDRRPARGRGTAQRDRGGTRQPARAEDGVQRREPRGDDAAVGFRGRDPGAARDGGCERRGREGVRRTGRVRGRVRHRHRRPCEGALGRQHQVSPAPWSGRAPAGLEGGECLGDVGCGSHRTSNNRTSVLLVKG